MTPISDGWHRHRDQLLARHPPDARARSEIERAYYAGAEHVVDALVGLNDAGLSLPFDIARQLTTWANECAHHENLSTFQGSPR